MAFLVQGFSSKLGIIMDGYLFSAPAIRSAIFKRGEITGDFTREEVQDLVDGWDVSVPVVRDLDAVGRDVFDIPGAPTLVVLDAKGTVQIFEVGANPDLAVQLPRILERLSGGADLANSQSFLKELCTLLDVPHPEPTQPDETHNRHVFEKVVAFNNGDGTTSGGRVDLHRGPLRSGIETGGRTQGC